MAIGEIIGVRTRGTDLSVPYRVRDLAASLPSGIRTLSLLAQSEPTADQAPLEAALGAYAEGERRDALRIPNGFFRSRTV